MLLSAKELIIKSYLLYRKNLVLFLKYSLLLYLPPVIMTTAAIFTGISLSLIAQNKYGLFTFLGIFFLDLVISSLFSLWFSLAFIRIIAKRYYNKTPGTMLEEIKANKPLIVPAIITSLVAGLAVLGGTLLLIVPGIIFGVWYIFSLPIVALEEKRGMEALNASKQLVISRWWKVFWLILAPILLYGFGAIVLDGVFLRMLISYTNIFSPTAVMVINILKGVLTWGYIFVSVPFLTTAQIILYLELKKHPIEQ